MPGWLFWFLLYAAATFCWLVFFEHGPGWDRFREGSRLEFERAWHSVQRWKASDQASGGSPVPAAAVESPVPRSSSPPGGREPVLPSGKAVSPPSPLPPPPSPRPASAP